MDEDFKKRIEESRHEQEAADLAWHEKEPFLSIREHGLGLPLLLLIAEGGNPEFKQGRQWLRVRHQTGGFACIQKEAVGTPLTPKGSLAMALAQLANRRLGSLWGQYPLKLEEINVYANDLKELDLSCNHSYAELAEGYYPIDLPEDLQSLVEDDLPEDLNDFVVWEKPDGEGKWEQTLYELGPAVQWSLVLLGPNCD